MLLRHLSGGELTEYAGGEMTGARRRRAQQHLGRCERCTRALEATWEVVGEMRVAPAVEAPYDLRARVAARVAAAPVRPISCRTARGFIQQDLDGVLPPLSVGLLRLHLDDCPACAEQQRTFAAATRLVRALEPVPAPVGIWDKVVAGGRARPARSWGVRLRPVLAAAAMAVGAVILGLHSLPRPADQTAPSRAGRRIAFGPVASKPSPGVSERAATQPVAPAPVVVAGVNAGISPAAASVAPQPRATMRRAVVRIVEPPPVSRVMAMAPAPTESTPQAEGAAVQPRKSPGLRALAMMAKAVSSESEGRVSLARELEPWEVFGDETISEVPLTAVGPAGAPGADSSGSSSGQPNTGAREAGPGLAGVMQNAA